MQILIDPDVQAMAEYMQERLPANRLTSIAKAVAAVAPLLWGDCPEEIQSIRLVRDPIIACAAHTRPCASV